MSVDSNTDDAMNTGNGRGQMTVGLRLLNIFYNMQDERPHPFMPIAPNRIKPLPQSASGTLSKQVMHRLVESVHPDGNEKGEVHIGSFHVSTGQFYDRLMNEMVGYGLGLQKDEPEKLRQGVAQALGANSFKDLENAYVVEGLSNQVKKQFAWVDEWYAQPKHLGTALDEVRQFGGEHPKRDDAIRNVAVWTSMREIADRVEAATLDAVNTNVLDRPAIARLSELANHFHNVDFGGDDQGRDWAPRWTATLKAVSTVAEEAYYKNPSVEAGALVTVVRAALADHEKAKELANPGKPVTQIVNPDMLHIFGPRTMAAGHGFQSQVRVA